MNSTGPRPILKKKSRHSVVEPPRAVSKFTKVEWLKVLDVTINDRLSFDRKKAEVLAGNNVCAAITPSTQNVIRSHRHWSQTFDKIAFKSPIDKDTADVKLSTDASSALTTPDKMISRSGTNVPLSGFSLSNTTIRIATVQKCVDSDLKKCSMVFRYVGFHWTFLDAIL